MGTLKLPRLGSTMDEGMIVAWKVSEGSHVEEGDVLYEVTTDKVNMEVEADYACDIMRVLVREGSTAHVGEPVALIAGGQDENEEPSHYDLDLAVAPLRIVRASPAARRKAREFEIDIQKIMGSGPRKRIVVNDVIKVIEAEKHSPSEPSHGIPTDSVSPSKTGVLTPFSGIRAVTAERMTASMKIPQVCLTTSVEASRILEAHKWFKTRHSVQGISLIDFILYSTIRALMQYPTLNGWVEERGFRQAETVDLGYAVSVKGTGLYVVCIHDAQTLNLTSLAHHRKTLSQAVMEHRATADDIGMPSFTVTNLGPFGVESFNPLLYPPQAGILGVGAVTDMGGISRVKLSLTFDHRANDGAEVAMALELIKENLEQPLLLL